MQHILVGEPELFPVTLSSKGLLPKLPRMNRDELRILRMVSVHCCSTVEPIVMSLPKSTVATHNLSPLAPYAFSFLPLPP